MISFLGMAHPLKSGENFTVRVVSWTGGIGLNTWSVSGCRQFKSSITLSMWLDLKHGQLLSVVRACLWSVNRCGQYTDVVSE